MSKFTSLGYENDQGTRVRWSEAAANQLERMEKLREAVSGFNLEVVESHFSKSIVLPVVRIDHPLGSFVIRDNFYGLNLLVLWNSEVNVPSSQIYGEFKDWDWYLGEIQRKREYSFKGWSEEEIEDPRILRVRVTNNSGLSYWRSVSGEEKDRWAARNSSPEWYHKDWSSCQILLEGEMGPGCRMYLARRAFAEGIDRYLRSLDKWDIPVYKPGAREFLIESGGYGDTEGIMKAIVSQGASAI